MIYLATIDKVGPYVAYGLAENMLITFDSNGPKDCLAYTVSLTPSLASPHATIAPGDRLQIGAHDYLINAVGEGAQQALFELGHLTLAFDGAVTPRHRGALHLTGPAPSPQALAGDFAVLEAAR
ncbi:PTS glucitol/sorbitol transporter subunit IIA [Citrobacter portucalensis]|uniref:PTS glucitol/sorbitol transporter subunit IIA n=1 Tax=Citrobacter portucalensis TaxID=1639133 RepID=UPI00226B04AF|nr:PTS glucitol/sorbitol transporter subunit IIA [Citrobacter portucalensis]MCX8988289.1 PTS sorbitol transporter [Citrobacter portucalensis]